MGISPLGNLSTVGRDSKIISTHPQTLKKNVPGDTSVIGNELLTKKLIIYSILTTQPLDGPLERANIGS